MSVEKVETSVILALGCDVSFSPSGEYQLACDHADQIFALRHHRDELWNVLPIKTKKPRFRVKAISVKSPS